MRASKVPLAVALVLVACAPDEEGGPFERMLEQPRYDTYEEGPFFPDGKVLQRPPPGTVPWGDADGRRGGAPVLPGSPAAAPPPTTPDLLALGRSRFRVYCAACHGPGGFGGSMVAVNMDPEHRPPPLRGPGAAELAPAEVFRHAREGTGRMPAYAAELTVQETWAVVAWLEELRGRAARGTEEVRDSVRAEDLFDRIGSLGGEAAGAPPGDPGGGP